jgi:ATP-dependent RNA helicase DDX56/DBP9
MKAKKQKQDNVDDEFDAARGIDFQGVKNVINYDFPSNERAYTHRIGRTARGGASGTALSLVEQDDPAQRETLSAVHKSQPLSNGEQQPQRLPLDIREVESLRYRVSDICRAITTLAVKEARLAELRNEILNSQQLKSHFEDNPDDATVLRHDEHLRPASVRSHMATIPDYLVPAGLRATSKVTRKRKNRKQQPHHLQHKRQAATNRHKNKHEDPLQSFAFAADSLVQSGGAPGKVTRRDPDAPVYALGRSTAGRNKWKKRHRKGQWKNRNKNKNRSNQNKGTQNKRPRLPGEA